MVEEEGSLGADSTNGHALEGEGASVAEMSRQDVIDALSGNTRTTAVKGGVVVTRIERIDGLTSSREVTDLFTPPEGPQEPQG